jgi:hypothetical protein
LKTFITFICTLMLVACGSTSKNVSNGSTPIVADGPPWELLPEAEQSVYVVDHACPDATAIVDSFSGWALAGPDTVPTNPEQVAPGTFIEVLVSPSGLMSMVQYVENDEDGRVNQMAMLFLAEGMALTMIDYNILRAFHTGAASPSDGEALSLATGEYFCVYM